MTLSELLAQSKGQPIRWQEHWVHAIYRVKAHDGLTLCLRWTRRGPTTPVQGVSFQLKGGRFSVLGTKSSGVVLWADRPEDVLLRCEGRGVKELSLWNCWRDSRGVMSAWVGNAGMLIDDRDPHVIRFRCNSNPDEITFDDLGFEIRIQDER